MASNQLSPGVVIQERDLTTTAVVPTANVGFIAGPFEQGPVEEIVDIVSENQLTEKFGEPNDYNYEYWFTAANYLSYGGLLKVVRVTHSDLKNAVDQGTAPLIKISTTTKVPLKKLQTLGPGHLVLLALMVILSVFL